MNEKIMIVDDDPNVLTLMEVIFSRKGFNVVTAGGAYQALALLAKELPALFILDVMMPGISGFELCQQLRERPDTANIPVLMLSARSDNEAVQRGLAVGANEFLPKATPHTVLVSKVQTLLGCNSASGVA